MRRVTSVTTRLGRPPRTIASTLVPKVITIKAESSQEGKIFGSVTTADIVQAVREQTGIELERRQIRIEQIKTLGQHQAIATLHADVSFPITVEVTAV